MFDVNANKILMEVSTAGLPADAAFYPPNYMPIDPIAVTPDNRLAVAAGLDGGRFVLFDIAELKLSRYYEEGKANFMFGYTVGCQKTQ